MAYFAVFDGHGGAHASQHAAKRLHVYLSQKLPKGNNGFVPLKSFHRVVVD